MQIAGLRLDDPWVWLSVAIGIVVGVLECLIVRRGMLLKRAFRGGFAEQRPRLWFCLDRAVAVAFSATGFVCLFAYIFLLRSLFSVPATTTYILIYVFACWGGVIIGYFPLLREFG